MIANIAQAYDLEIAAGTQDNGVGASVQDAQRTWVFFFRTVIENNTRADGFFSTVIPK
jgi:hypothetical protein